MHIKTKNANYFIDNGIVICEVNSDIILDLDMARRLVAERKKVIPAKDFPFLMIVRNYLLLDKQAFICFGSEDSLTGLCASAIVIKSSLHRLLANFSLFFQKQSKPYRLFNKTSDAKLWLFKFILENEDDEFDVLRSSEGPVS